VSGANKNVSTAGLMPYIKLCPQILHQQCPKLHVDILQKPSE